MNSVKCGCFRFVIILVSVVSAETDAYLLFSNSFHINRATLNGSHYEILYSEESGDGIIAIDYDYRCRIIIRRDRRIYY